MNIAVNELFGRFNYNITLFNGNNRIAILTGPNGFGKSTILHCIKAVCESDLSFFENLLFQSIKVSSGQDELFIEKKPDTLIVNGIELSNAAFPTSTRSENADTERAALHFYLRTLDNELESASHFADIIKMLEERKKGKERVGNKSRAEVLRDVLQLMAKIGGKAIMIEEQRLLQLYPDRENRKWRSREVIERISDSLKNNIAQVATEYSKKSTELDASLPYRLLNESESEPFDEENFQRLNSEMQVNLQSLQENGISETRFHPNLQYTPKDSKILRILLEDFNKKFDVYRPMIDKITLFKEIVNRRLMFKKVIISPKDGLVVQDTDSSREIPLKNLSSGEKEIVVLFYRLIFETEAGATLLIDEPEISLHLAWQKPFVKDLQKVAEQNNLRAIIATHSSAIIGGHRNIQVDLGELYQDGK